MSQNDFATSPPATGGDAALAADLVSNAAYAMSPSGDETARTKSETHARSGLTHEHADVRVSAIAALDRLSAFTTDDLQFSLSDLSSLVRRRGVEAAAQLVQQSGGSSDVAAALTDALDDDHSVVEVSCFALGEFGPENPAITSDADLMNRIPAGLRGVATGHEDPLCRESAVAALGALHLERETILAALSDKATVRRRAVLALAPFDGDEVKAALEKALTDRDWQVRQAAEDQVAARQ